MEIASGRVRIATGPGMTLGYEPDAGRLWMANASRRTYWEGTVEELCAAIKQQKATADEQMLGQIDQQIPPAMREKLREEMKRHQQAQESGPPAANSTARPAVKVSVERTGDTATIAGQPAQEFRVLANGKPYSRVWLTSDAALSREMNFANLGPLMSRAQACLVGNALAQMKKGMDQYQDPVSRRAVGADRITGMVEARELREAVEASEEYRQLLSLGWPLRTVSEAAPVVEVTRVERIELREADLRAPASFTKVGPGEVMGGSSTVR